MNNKKQQFIPPQSYRTANTNKSKAQEIQNQPTSRISKTEESNPPLSGRRSTTKSPHINNPLLTNAQMNEVIKKERKHYYGKFLFASVLVMITEQYFFYVIVLEYWNLKCKMLYNY